MTRNFVFQVGEHIPTVPPAIARALAWAATAKPWVDPWMIEQKKLKADRQARKLKKNEKKSKTMIEKDEIENVSSE